MADSALASDYIERASSSGWPRSYPSWWKTHWRYHLGCIWDDALAHGNTVRDYGEFTWMRQGLENPGQKGVLDFLASYRDFVNGSNAIVYTASQTWRRSGLMWSRTRRAGIWMCRMYFEPDSSSRI